MLLNDSYTCGKLAILFLLSIMIHFCSANPCEPHNGYCEHNCTSNDGIHPKCHCIDGYELYKSNFCRGLFLQWCVGIFILTDINECLNEMLCDHTCINTAGSYYCECNTGYELDNDNHTCNGKL